MSKLFKAILKNHNALSVQKDGIVFTVFNYDKPVYKHNDTLSVLNVIFSEQVNRTARPILSIYETFNYRIKLEFTAQNDFKHRKIEILIQKRRAKNSCVFDDIAKNDYPKGVIKFLNTAKYKAIEMLVNDYNNQLFFCINADYPLNKI